MTTGGLKLAIELPTLTCARIERLGSAVRSRSRFCGVLSDGRTHVRTRAAQSTVSKSNEIKLVDILVFLLFLHLLE